MGYRIIVDSCGELTDEMKRSGLYETASLSMQVDGVTIADDETFDQADFLKRIAASPECPKSSCPSPEKYMELYRCDAERVYAVTLSSELSGSYNSAELGKKLYKEEYGGKKIHVFNSRSASVGETLIALKIQECEEAGMPFEEVVSAVERYIEGQHTYFVLENLDTLRKNGRLTGIKSIVASALNIKPVMGSTPKGTICQLGQAHQFYIEKYISQFGLTADDITFINMEDAAGAQAFMTGNGDVIGTKMPYCYDMCVTDGGYTIAASVEDATGIEIRDPVLFTPEAIESRHDEIVIFLQVIYGLINDWANDYESYKAAVNEFYNDNGKEFDDAKVDYEFALNRLFTTEVVSGEDYYMGEGMQAVADFYGKTGAIAAENVDIYKNYDTSLLSEALGVDVKAFSK